MHTGVPRQPLPSPHRHTTFQDAKTFFVVLAYFSREAQERKKTKSHVAQAAAAASRSSEERTHRRRMRRGVSLLHLQRPLRHQLLNLGLCRQQHEERALVETQQLDFIIYRTNK